MQPAHEQPDTAEVVVDVIFARIAVVFALLTIGVPLVLAACR